MKKSIHKKQFQSRNVLDNQDEDFISDDRINFGHLGKNVWLDALLECFEQSRCIRYYQMWYDKYCTPKI